MSSDVNGLYLTEQKRIHEFMLILKTSKQMAERAGRRKNLYGRMPNNQCRRKDKRKSPFMHLA